MEKDKKQGRMKCKKRERMEKKSFLVLIYSAKVLKLCPPLPGFFLNSLSKGSLELN